MCVVAIVLQLSVSVSYAVCSALYFIADTRYFWKFTQLILLYGMLQTCWSLLKALKSLWRVIQISLEAMKSSIDEVALQGIEFWSTVCDEEVDLAIEASEVNFIHFSVHVKLAEIW